MKSILVSVFLLVIMCFLPKRGSSQIIIEDNLQNDVNAFEKLTNSKGTMVESEYLKNIEFQPFVITQDETFSLSCEAKINGIKSIIIYWESNSINSIYLHNNNSADSLILVDDGQNDDEKANDNIFTISNLRRNPDFPPFTPEGNTGSDFFRYRDVKYQFDNGSVITEKLDLACGIRFINGHNVEIPNVKAINDTIQYSSHVINFVMDWNWNQSKSDYYLEYRRITNTLFKTYYKYFEDDRDFISICSTYPYPDAPAAQFGSLRSDVIGVRDCPNNNCIYDNSYMYGSNGRLMGTIDECFTYGGTGTLIIHEILHQWAADLNPNLYLTDGTGHWGVVEFQTSGFNSGLQMSKIYHYKDNIYRVYRDWATYSNRFNTLEMYLMGLLPFDSVSFPIKTLINYKYLRSTLFDNSVVPNIWGDEYTADSIHYVTRAEYLKYMPLRNPDYTHSQKDFNMALIVFSKRLLTPKEMAYYNHNMEVNENKDIQQGYNPGDLMGINFYNATRGRGTLTTRLSGIVDKDNDGYNSDVDCDDNLNWVHPNAVEIPNNLTDENCDGIITSIEYPELKDIKIYPNPTKGILNIDNETSVCYSMYLRDINGTLLIQKDIELKHNIINVDNLPAGIYIIELVNVNTNARSINKIIIE